ncbi:MAG: hypothetical protein CSA33_00270 [Desulfobulbus propionicus]|nr:MAG: hypothetical protein CSA33_00270 [Desulfobulbus propionicus]
MESESTALAPTLRSDLHFTIQNGTARCYVLEDPLRQKFYRIGRAEYVLLTTLDGKRSLSQAIATANELLQEDIFDEKTAEITLQWLIHNQLILDSNRESVEGRLRVDNRVRQQKLLSQFNLITIKIPLFNPDPFVEKMYPWLGWLTGRYFACIWAGIVFYGGLLLFQQADAFLQTAAIALAPGNIFFLWLSWFLLKLLHEASHALTCYRYHGRIYEAGLLFIVFFPLTYVNASSSWNFPGKWQRMHAAFAGIYAELFVAGFAALIWAENPHTVVGNLAHNLVLVAGFSSLLFNINPLMRFDGYFILSDMVGIPNLYGRGQEFVTSIWRAMFFGQWSYIRRLSWRQELFIACYGIAAWCWRFLVMTFLLLLAASAFQGYGIFIALVSAILLVGPPFLRLKNTLVSMRVENPSGFRRFFLVCALGGLAGVLLVQVVQWEQEIKAPAVVLYEDEVLVKSQVPGFLETMYVHAAEEVVAGQPLCLLRNAELVAEEEQLQVQLAEVLINKRHAHMQEDITSYQMFEENSAVLLKRVRALQSDIEDLQIVAESAGTVLAHRLDDLQGTYIQKGREVMSIVSEGRKKILASVDQEAIAAFRQRADEQVEVIIPSMNRSSFFARVVRIAPKAETLVPDRGLSAAYGGPLAVRQVVNEKSPGGGDAVEFEFFSPRFSVELAVPPQKAGQLLVGQLVTIRLPGQRLSLWQVITTSLYDYFALRLDPTAAR